MQVLHNNFSFAKQHILPAIFLNWAWSYKAIPEQQKISSTSFCFDTSKYYGYCQFLRQMKSKELPSALHQPSLANTMWILKKIESIVGSKSILFWYSNPNFKRIVYNVPMKYVTYTSSNWNWYFLSNASMPHLVMQAVATDAFLCADQVWGTKLTCGSGFVGGGKKCISPPKSSGMPAKKQHE